LVYGKHHKAIVLAIVVVLVADIGPLEAAEYPATDATEQQLLREVEERDTVIRDLQRRVEELERQSQTGAKRPPAAATPKPSTKPPHEALRPQEAASRAAPGQFEVDEGAAERALERTLVQAGVLLLPPGVLDLEPGFSYTRTENDTPGLFVDDAGNTLIVSRRVRRNIYDADLQLRLGLPFDSQIEFLFPYRWVDESQVQRVGFTPADTEDRSGSGFRDIQVGIAKTLLREGANWPDLVARVTWDTDTGERDDNDVIIGGGFNSVVGTLSAVKRQDPLAFVGAFAYEKTFEEDHIEPGQQFRLSLGVALAASPQTSLRFTLQQVFIDEIEVDNQKIDGSDQVEGVLIIGASSIVGRGLFLDVSGDVGLTDDAADYSVNVSLSKRVDLRSLLR
jgi:hypothetical protein